MAVLNFTVKRVKKRRDRFAEVIGIKLQCSNSMIQKEMRREMEIKGEFPLSINEGDQFEVQVTKKMDLKYATPYFEIIPGTDIKRTGLENKKIMAKFLQTKINVAPRQEPKLQKWKISLSCCEKIIDIIGDDVFNILIKDSTILLNYPILKLNDIKVKEIQRILLNYRELQKIVVTLQTSKLPLRVIFQLYDTYGEQTLSTIMDNPYKICYDGALPFKMADKIAFDSGFHSDDNIRIRTAIMDYILYQVKNGSTCCSVMGLFNKRDDRIIENLNDYLNLYSAYRFNEISNEQIFKQIEILIQDGKLIQHQMSVDFDNARYSGYLYIPRQYKTEMHLAKLIKNISQMMNLPFCSLKEVDDFLNYYESTYNVMLANEQKNAVRNAMTNKMFILTGGPGTGKTLTVSVIVACIKYISQHKYHRNANFKLVAPTGKAAERMTELTNEPASTIHRALNISFCGTVELTLDYDFLIIDEGSMIDQDLMDLLLSHISDNTRIMIVGDPNQLPSVGSGRVLEEILRCNYIPYTELRTIFRQTAHSAIIDIASNICNGITSTMPNGIKLTNDPTQNFRFIEENTIEGIKANLVSTIDNLLHNGISIATIQVLTPKRNGELGVITLNDLMQERYNPNPILYENEDFGLKFKINDKVIQTSNNYELGVFNGFIGTIIDIDDTNIKNGILDPIITVEYEGLDNPILYSGSCIHELELAYVLTIHKSQGSEYPHVFMPIHMEQEIMLNRKLLYTGVTRAKKDCTIIGEEKAINKAIATQMDSSRRLTNLADFVGIVL